METKNEIATQSGYKNLRRGNPTWGNKLLGTGKSGNPNGSEPSKISITAEMRKLLPLPCKYDPKFTWAQYLAERGLSLAATKPEAMKNVQDRLEGKVVEPLEVSGKDGLPIVFSVTYEVVNGKSG